jgi:hypothetical protein
VEPAEASVSASAVRNDPLTPLVARHIRERDIPVVVWFPVQV